jgi:hypothetical protein
LHGTNIKTGEKNVPEIKKELTCGNGILLIFKHLNTKGGRQMAVKKKTAKKATKKVAKKATKKASKKVVKKAAKKTTKKAAKKTVEKAVKKAAKKATKKNSKKVVKKVAKKAAKTSVAKTGAKKKVSLTYYSPDSGHVEIAGSFNSWKPQKMKKSADGVWSVSLTLPVGEYQYKYVFDGISWEVDSNAPSMNFDGVENNILKVD